MKGVTHQKIEEGPIHYEFAVTPGEDGPLMQCTFKGARFGVRFFTPLADMRRMRDDMDTAIRVLEQQYS